MRVRKLSVVLFAVAVVVAPACLAGVPARSKPVPSGVEEWLRAQVRSVVRVLRPRPTGDELSPPHPAPVTTRCTGVDCK